MSRATGAATLSMAVALVLPGSPAAAAEPEKTMEVRSVTSVLNLDAETTESLLEEEIHRTRKVSGARGPFTIEVPTEQRCEVEVADYPDNPFARDRYDALWHEVYLVTPTPAGSTGPRWTRTFTGETICKSPPIPKPAASVDTSTRRVSELAVLPVPTLGVAPGAEGITGLPVHLWAEGLPAGWLSFPPAVLDGKRIEVQARPIRFSWDTGDVGTAAPQSSYATEGPGDPASPAVVHVYETKSSVGRPDEGAYTITLDVTWDRRYRVVGLPDPCNDWCDLGTGRTGASKTYRVAEVRALLVP